MTEKKTDLTDPNDPVTHEGWLQAFARFDGRPHGPALLMVAHLDPVLFSRAVRILGEVAKISEDQVARFERATFEVLEDIPRLGKMVVHMARSMESDPAIGQFFDALRRATDVPEA